MSDAPRFDGVVRIRLTSLTTGASSPRTASAATDQLFFLVQDLEVTFSDCWRSSMTFFSSSDEVVP
jgi:hypothetical protein